MTRTISREEVINTELFDKAVRRGIIEITKSRITYNIGRKASYSWDDPEEWVRAHSIAFLILERGYPANRIRTEVKVPRRTPSDLADIVVYRDDACKDPYLVVENKRAGQSDRERAQAIEQLFGNTNSLGATFGLYDEFVESIFYDVRSYPAGERQLNIKGGRSIVPLQYGNVPRFAYIAGPGNSDIKPAKAKVLENKIKRAHSIIWSGGKRDPLTAFEEWSKLLFAKTEDERNTPNGKPRRFQIGTNETTAAVASRIHDLFEQARKSDRTMFPEETRIDLPDTKIFQVVQILQDISIVSTTADAVGAAFEGFFGSVFRGELGQYFTMRPLARFVVAMLDISHDDYVIDPTAGSGGFLLEVLLQVWFGLDEQFAGRPDLGRLKNDFALHKVFGIEIHEVLSRICKINLLLHHDGHTNIEGDRTCLDSVFSKDRLNPWQERFTRVVGNPPFGDEVREGDEDLLGSNTLATFEVATGRSSVPSEHAVVERAVDMLEPGGRFGLILPDGFFNNQGESSNCPAVRRFLARHGAFEAIVSLPDHAFRKSGAQNKTSILFFRKYTRHERTTFDRVYEASSATTEADKIADALKALNYRVFVAEAKHIGYTPSGALTQANDLYRGHEGGRLDADQSGTILGEWREFQQAPGDYAGKRAPDTTAVPAHVIWQAHRSNRLDPKYHLFKHAEAAIVPEGWTKVTMRDVMTRRVEHVKPEERPDEAVKVLTIGQSGDIRLREPGKGLNPPEWLGMYFEEIPSKWYAAHTGDVVFSSIDLWKGCISVVDEEFDGGLVTKEFPIYQITDDRLDPAFVSCLLRSRYYQRAFRAITTGHSNRRRTQVEDFEDLEIAFPADREAQLALVADVLEARQAQREAATALRDAMLQFSNVIDGRGDEPFEDDVEADRSDE